MGRITVYRRRNTTAQCFNDEDLDVELKTINCTCIEDDYECDFGYSRNSNGECYVTDAAMVPVSPPAYCPEGKTYYQTNGFAVSNFAFWLA